MRHKFRTGAIVRLFVVAFAVSGPATWASLTVRPAWAQSAAAIVTPVPGPPAARLAAAPWYVVLATDVSPSMNRADPLVKDGEGKLQALRDDGQATFLQLLPFLHANNYIGVCQFAETISYSRPGAAEAPGRVGDPPMLPWQDTHQPPEKLRDLVRSITPTNNQGTRVDVALDWSRRAIEAARAANKGQAAAGQGDRRGRGMVILLTDGDPDAASATRVAVGGAARELAAAGIAIYPIILNTRSYHPGRPEVPLTPAQARGEAEAEKQMDDIAAATGGKAYRITPTFSLLDAFTDILSDSFTAGPQFTVSGHHRTVVVIGTPLQSVQINPAGPAGGGGADRGRPAPYTLTVSRGTDAGSGIDQDVVPLTTWEVLVLRRPARFDAAAQPWVGGWSLVTRGGGEFKGRIYLVPDFLLQVEPLPAADWYAYERAQVRVRLDERPKELGEGARAVPPLSGRNLSLSLTVGPADGGTPLRLDGKYGRWDADGRNYLMDVYLGGPLARPGRYRVTCECADQADGRAVLLGRFDADVTIAPAPMALRLVKADESGAERTALEVPAPEAGAAGGPAVACRGGERVRALIEPRPPGRAADLPNLSGKLYLANAAPTTRPFRVDGGGGRLAAEPIVLPESDTHLAGSAEVAWDSPAGPRRVRLPDFDLRFGAAPLRLEQHFTERRKALWVGEFHEQAVDLSVLPVFPDAVRALTAAFLAELPEADVYADDPQVPQAPQAAGPAGRAPRTPLAARARREGEPRPGPGAAASRLTATYRFAADVPIPPGARRVVINPGTVVSGLRPAGAAYPVVDPAAAGLFAWTVGPPGGGAGSAAGSGTLADAAGPSAGPGKSVLADVLYRGEPVEFAARWRADQNVSAVSFQVYPQGSDKAFVVALPVARGDTVARAEGRVDAIPGGRAGRVVVQVVVAPQGPGSEMPVRLAGGQFRAEDRKLELKTFDVGGTSGADIACRALELVTLPLHAVVTGYVPGSPQHAQDAQDVEAFKKSCALKVTTAQGVTQDLSTAIEWTTVQPVPPPAGSAPGTKGSFEFVGRAVYVPTRTGKQEAAFTAEFMRPDGRVGTFSALVRLSVGEPRVLVRVYEARAAGAGGDRLLFDSAAWVAGQPPAPLPGSYFSTNLRLNVQRNAPASPAVASPAGGAAAAEPAKASVTWIRRPSQGAAAGAASGDAGGEPLPGEAALPAGAPGADFTATPAKAGTYSPVVVLTGPKGEAVGRLELPPVWAVLAAVPTAVRPPSRRITPAVRQWPFEYRLPLPDNWDVPTDALVFQFKLPGAADWVRGTTAEGSDNPDPKAAKPGGRFLTMAGPPFLPPPSGLASGAVQFSLRREASQGELTWSFPEVVVVDPVLTATFAAGAAPLGPADKRVNAPARIGVDPARRSSPETENWWRPRDPTVYIIRGPSGAPKDGPDPAESADQLLRLVNGEAPATAAREIGAEAPLRFWGWPVPRFGSDTSYIFYVHAPYALVPSAGPGAHGAPAGDGPVVGEWVIRRVTVRVPWWRATPVVTWPVLAAAVAALGLAVRRALLVRGPTGLGLTLQLIGGNGDLRPTPAQKAPRADVRPLPLSQEAGLYARHWRKDTLAGRWLAAAYVLARRVWLKEAVVGIEPRQMPRATDLEFGLVRVSSPPTARGEFRVSAVTAGGAKVVPLPAPGKTTEWRADLTYKDARGTTMNNPITLRLIRAQAAAPPHADRAPRGHGGGGSNGTPGGNPASPPPRQSTGMGLEEMPTT